MAARSEKVLVAFKDQCDLTKGQKIIQPFHEVSTLQVFLPFYKYCTFV